MIATRSRGLGRLNTVVTSLNVHCSALATEAISCSVKHSLAVSWRPLTYARAYVYIVIITDTVYQRLFNRFFDPC